MQAVVLSRYGSPQTSLRIQDIPKPTPSADQVRVEVRATAINDWDWSLARGRPLAYRLMFGLRKPKVTVLGAELAGVVESVGARVTRFRPGDLVYGDVSEAGFGGFGEYACVPEPALMPMPAGLSFEEAAALPHAAMLAWQGLVDIGEVQNGERVLINGAAGGVGILGLQIAKEKGAHVTGVDRGFKLEALDSVGFDRVIDFEKEDFTAGGERYDLIFDTKTTRSPFRYLRSLSPAGRYVTVGGDLPRLIQVACWGPILSRILKKQVCILGLKPNKGLDALRSAFESGRLRGRLDRAYGLRDVPEAVQRFGESKHVGKIVVTVSRA